MIDLISRDFFLVVSIFLQ